MRRISPPDAADGDIGDRAVGESTGERVLCQGPPPGEEGMARPGLKGESEKSRTGFEPVNELSSALSSVELGRYQCWWGI